MLFQTEMVGGGYKGYVTYVPYAFNLSYFLPGYAESNAVDSAATATATTDVAATSSDTTDTDTTLANSSSDASVVVVPITHMLAEASSHNPENQTIHSTTEVTSETVVNACGDATTIETIDMDISTASGKKTASVIGVHAHVPPRVGHPEDPTEGMDFNVISMRTSGF